MDYNQPVIPNSKLNPKKCTRREFLKWAGLAGAAALAAACQPVSQSAPSATPPAATAVPTEPAATATSTPIPATATPIPLTATPAYRATAAIAKLDTYEAGPLKETLGRMLADLGGWEGLLTPGARVGIKTNLTGGPWWDGPDKPLAVEYFVTHPAVVGALAELAREAGAGEVFILDGVWDEINFSSWGYTEMAQRVGAQLVNLCQPAPYGQFIDVPVGPDYRVYPSFRLNPLLTKLDMLISVAKLKPHSTTGVTLAMKNLFGLAPIEEYRRDPADTNRSAFHESVEFDTRVPGVILDLNRAVPIKLAVIDGIMTAEGGAGPWDAGLAQVRPGLLVASRDPVAADAVGAALMGFDPQGQAGVSPYIGSPNHLTMACEAGLGTNRLNEIGIYGPAIADVRYPFKPAR